MSVRPRKFRVKSTYKVPEVTAGTIMNTEHPLYNSLVKFCRGNVTKRQARKFLAKYPQFKEIRNVE